MFWSSTRNTARASKTGFFDQDPVGLAEGAIPEVGEGLHLIHSGRRAPPALRKRQVHADGQDDRVFGQLSRLLVEAVRFRVANGGVQGGNGADDFQLAAEGVQSRDLQGSVQDAEVGGPVAHLHLGAEEGEGVPSNRHQSGPFFPDGPESGGILFYFGFQLEELSFPRFFVFVEFGHLAAKGLDFFSQLLSESFRFPLGLIS